MSTARSIRLKTLAAAPVAAVLAWTVLRLAGADLRADPGPVGPLDVLLATALAGGAAWLVAGQLERRVRRPSVAWVWLGTTAVSVSMLGPTYSAGAVTALHLMTLHLVVGAVLVGGFAVSLPVHRERRSAADPELDDVVLR